MHTIQVEGDSAAPQHDEHSLIPDEDSGSGQQRRADDATQVEGSAAEDAEEEEEETPISELTTASEKRMCNIALGLLIAQGVVECMILSEAGVALAVFGAVSVHYLEMCWLKWWLIVTTTYTIAVVGLLIFFYSTDFICYVTDDASWCDDVELALVIADIVVAVISFVALSWVAHIYCYFFGDKHPRIRCMQNDIVLGHEEECGTLATTELHPDAMVVHVAPKETSIRH